METEMSEREEVQEVFGLTGGELMDKAWVAQDDQEKDWTFAYWYEGSPEYARRDDLDNRTGTYRTVITNEMFITTPERLDGEWVKVATFRSSGEAENENEDGLIYIGDGWTEVVYQAEQKS